MKDPVFLNGIAIAWCQLSVNLKTTVFKIYMSLFNIRNGLLYQVYGLSWASCHFRIILINSSTHKCCRNCHLHPNHHLHHALLLHIQLLHLQTHHLSIHNRHHLSLHTRHHLPEAQNWNELNHKTKIVLQMRLTSYSETLLKS